MYMSYGNEVPLFEREGSFSASDGTNIALSSSQNTHKSREGRVDNNTAGDQYPVSSGYDGNAGFRWVSEPPSWGNNLGNSAIGDFGGLRSPGTGYMLVADGSGNDPGTDSGSDPRQDLGTVGPEVTLPIVKQGDPPQSVPEPASLTLLASGLLSILAVLKKRLG
jgi:hypothetical protein